MSMTVVCLIIVVAFIAVAIIKKTAKLAFIAALIYLSYIFAKAQGWI